MISEQEEDLEDFISRVVSESEDISDVKKLALEINKIGSSIADISEEYRNNLSDLETRIEEAEDDFELLVERLMEAPPGSINTQNLNIRRPLESRVGVQPSSPTPQMSSPAQSGPNLKSPPTGPSPTPTPATSGSNLKSAPAGPDLNAAPPQPSGGPNLQSSPTVPSSAPSTTPGSGPNLKAAPPQPSGGAPNLKSAPAAGPNLDAVPPQSSGGPNLKAAPGAGTVADALKNLKKAPQKDPSETAPPVPGGGGVTAGSIQDALKNLKKAPKQEKKEPAASGMGGSPFRGFNPAEALKNLKKAPKKEEEEQTDDGGRSEFASILEKRRDVGTEDTVDKAEAKKIEEPSAEEMKSQLQSKLKQAFKK